MIYTQHGEPVEIIDGPNLNLLDPSTVDQPLFTVRSLNDPSWTCQRRRFELKADGGPQEIDAAVTALGAK
jgi:hypothetical protein